MFRLLLIYCLTTLSLSLTISAQVPDFISVKKRNGITAKSYYAGINISMVTKDGRSYDALIDRIANDSIYLRYFDVFRYTNISGTISYDTLTSYILPICYKDIKYVITPKVKYRKSYLSKLGTYAAIGGFGYDFLNIFNGLTQKYNPRFSNRDKRNLAIATGVGALGLYASNVFRKQKNKYNIVYINMSEKDTH